MLDLFRAEWSKTTGNRWVTGCMIWIFPVSTIGLFIVLSLIVSLSASARAEFAGNHHWTNDMVAAWDIQSNFLSRLILVAFTAVMFAGEYQWGTWKNVIPRSKRIPLILVKFATLSLLIMIAFALVSVIMVIGVKILLLISGGSYGPSLTVHVLGQFLRDYLFKASLAFISSLIMAAYAALAAILTRSIMGGLIVGAVITFVEMALLDIALRIIAHFLHFPQILNVHRATPIYNLNNVTSWINDHHAFNLNVDYGSGKSVVLSDPLLFSIVVLAAWVFGLIGLTLYLFRRQDITS